MRVIDLKPKLMNLGENEDYISSSHQEEEGDNLINQRLSIFD